MFNIKKWYLCMNKKHFLFSAIGVFFLSFAAAISLSSRDFAVAKADDPVDVGAVRLSLNTGGAEIGTSNAIHLISDVTNEFPVSGWDNYFTSTESNSLTLNGTDIHNGNGGVGPVRLKKIDAQKYYLALNDSGYASRNAGDTIVIKGNWTGTVSTTTYSLLVKDFSATWNGSKWVQNFVVPELEAYDKISLKDLSLDDINYTTISTENDTNNYNSFSASANNPHHNIAFEFYYEMNQKIDANLDIRIGGDKAWDDSDHFYQFFINNSWGPHGLAFLYEKVKGSTPPHKVEEIDCGFEVNVRYKIEIGLITVKDTTSNEVYFYLKNNDTFLFQEIFNAQTLERTNRIGFSYVKTNLFLGNTLEQKENTDSLVFDHSEGTDGIYFNGPENDFPLNLRAAPATKYNLYKNDAVLFNFPFNGIGPLMKKGPDSYYLSFSENHIEVEEGDVISIGGEFHVYSNGKTYVLAVVPFCVKRVGAQFVDAGTLDDYLKETITNYVNFNDYDDDKVDTLNGLIASTKAAVQSANGVKEKWQAFEDGKDEIDAIPPKEELLIRVKQQAIEQLNAYNDGTLYEADDLLIVQGYINTALSQIDVATTIKQVKTAVDNAITQIKTVATRQEHVEYRILHEEGNYQEYLAKHEVITTSDLCATGNLMFYPQDDSEHETYWTQFGPNSIYGRFATTSDNQEGNVIFKFKYESTNPNSKKHASQIFIRLRGTASDCYIFNIGRKIDDHIGVSFGKFINNAMADEKFAQYPFAANTPVEIEMGAVDLKDYNRVYLYIKIAGEIKVADIVDPVVVQHAPTVLIQDSYTADGSGETATMSPVETGTTKSETAITAGRLVVDPSSNSETLLATLRKNSIPSSTNLYPIEKDAFLYNGNEINNFHAGAMVRKLTDNQYLITTAGLNIADGDTITVDGCFAYFNEGTRVKTAVKLSETTFTYHASTNSWTQTEQSLVDAQTDAKDYLDSYVVIEAYSEANQTVLQGILESYKNQIDDATTIAAIDQLVDAAIVAIDAVPTILGEYKNAAKTALNNYKSPSIYRENEQNQLAKLLSDACQRIDACGDKDAVDYIVLTTKQAIDQLKTADEYYAEELQSKQRSAKAEIESFIGKVELNRYSEDNAALIQQLALKARKDVDAATTLEEVDRIVSDFKQAVINVATADGSVFDGEKYTKKKKGCGGEVITMAVTIPVISVAALAILLVIRKRESYLNK